MGELAMGLIEKILDYFRANAKPHERLGRLIDRLLTVRFHSSLGQASADREPLELIATKDQPPSIVVEKPGLDVVLPAVQPLPISARAVAQVPPKPAGATARLSAPHPRDGGRR